MSKPVNKPYPAIALMAAAIIVGSFATYSVAATASPDCYPHARASGDHQVIPTPTPYCPETYLELIVDKPMVEIGELFSVTIIYHNLGQPWVYGFNLNPEGIAVFDPLIESWPCKLCSDFSFRAAAVGRVELRAGATGERYCNGWMWAGGYTKIPAVVFVVEEKYTTRLPVMMR